MAFPIGSAGKESDSNAGDTRDAGSIPGWGRSPGEGNGKPLQWKFHRQRSLSEIQSIGSQRVGQGLATEHVHDQ